MSTKRMELRVANLDCEHDAAAIERGLQGFGGIVALKVYPKSAKVEITYDLSATSPRAVEDKLTSLGFPVQKGMGMAEQPKVWRNPKVITSVTSGVLLAVGWLLGVGGLTPPFTTGVFVAAILIGGYYFGREATEELIFERECDMTFLETVEKEAGTLVRKCYQCGRCSGDCPTSFAMDILPNRIMRMVQLGRKEELLNCKSIWVCNSCLTCSTVCPMELDVAGVIDALRMMSPKSDRVKTFNDIFLKGVRKGGRIHEASLVIEFNLRTGNPFHNATKSLPMMQKGKLPILPGQSLKEIRPIFDRFMKGGEA